MSDVRTAVGRAAGADSSLTARLIATGTIATAAFIPGRTSTDRNTPPDRRLTGRTVSAKATAAGPHTPGQTMAELGLAGRTPLSKEVKEMASTTAHRKGLITATGDGKVSPGKPQALSNGNEFLSARLSERVRATSWRFPQRGPSNYPGPREAGLGFNSFTYLPHP